MSLEHASTRDPMQPPSREAPGTQPGCAVCGRSRGCAKRCSKRRVSLLKEPRAPLHQLPRPTFQRLGCAKSKKQTTPTPPNVHAEWRPPRSQIHALGRRHAI